MISGLPTVSLPGQQKLLHVQIPGDMQPRKICRRCAVLDQPFRLQHCRQVSMQVYCCKDKWYTHCQLSQAAKAAAWRPRLVTMLEQQVSVCASISPTQTVVAVCCHQV